MVPSHRGVAYRKQENAHGRSKTVLIDIGSQSKKFYRQNGGRGEWSEPEMALVPGSMPLEDSGLSASSAQKLGF